MQQRRRCTNGAENLFSRLRRAEIGHHHPYFWIYLGRCPPIRLADDHRGGERRPIPGDHRACRQEQAERRFLWILAAHLTA